MPRALPSYQSPFLLAEVGVAALLTDRLPPSHLCVLFPNCYYLPRLLVPCCSTHSSHLLFFVFVALYFPARPPTYLPAVSAHSSARSPSMHPHYARHSLDKAKANARTAQRAGQAARPPTGRRLGKVGRIASARRHVAASLGLACAASVAADVALRLRRWIDVAVNEAGGRGANEWHVRRMEAGRRTDGRAEGGGRREAVDGKVD